MGEGSGETGRGRRRTAQLTERDKHLMAALGVARYLSEPQLARLLFSERMEAARKRLLKLSAITGRYRETPAYVRRVFLNAYDGRRKSVWALAEPGFQVAEFVLGPLKRPLDVGAAFLEHTIALNELLVQLLAITLPPTVAAPTSGSRLPRGRAVFARVTDARFRWIASDSARLPWTEYEQGKQVVRNRVIQPDAVLEFAALRRRVFIECEMGTHSIVAESDEKSGATLAKVERYETFMTGLSDVASRATFYAKTYPDDFAPELLFLVMSDARAASVNSAIAHWRKQGFGRSSIVQAKTLADATSYLLSALGTAPAGTETKATKLGHATLSPEELDALKRFYIATCTQFKTMRDSARAKRAAVPDYPPGTNELSHALTRLGLLRPRPNQVAGGSP